MGEMDRIRWQCRRGLLELDLVLAAFLESVLRGMAQLEGTMMMVLSER